MAGKLILISVPAGFGKTTLLSEWVAGCGRPVAWVSLDKADNDPARFWAYVIFALQTAHPNVGEAALAALQSPQPPPIEMPLTSLINEIAEIPDPLVLVLDDFHMITGHQVHDGITFLVDNLPPQMHLVLSSRANPPWPLARMRARREITELRVDDLRFTPAEAAAFLNDVMGLGLSAEEIATLDTRTEGWIAGLQMAALSMQGRTDVTAFIKAFSGSHRFVLDYLVEEVLDRQSSAIQAFLLKTSILDRLTALLCDVVTDSNDSQTILIQLEQANLFLVPLDDERRWYRYHRLFADLLRSRLQQTQADQVPTLHCRASEWYEKNDLIAEAVSHALTAGDIERVARLVEGNALAMMDRGELTTLVGWLDALPDEVVCSRPWLCVAHAWVLAYAGQADAVEPLLRDAEKALDGFDQAAKADVEGQRIAGHIAAIRTYVAGLRGDMSRSAELAREALERLSEEDLMARGWTALMLGFALRYKGDLVGAAHALAEATAISQMAGDSHVVMLVLCELAALQFLQGRLHKAAATCRDALQSADEYARRGGQRLPVTGYAYARMSNVLREWNDLEAALRHAREGLELCKQWRQADALLEGYIHLARALQAIGDADGALSAIQEAKQVASDVSPWFVVYAEAYEARLWLAQGDVATAALWAQESGLSIDDDLSFQYEFIYRTLARILVTQSRSDPTGRLLDEALGLLAQLLQVVEVVGAMGSAIEILVLQAMALQAQGEGDQALTALERALSLAEPEGFVRIFIDEGAPMGRLLRQAIAHGSAADYAGKLLAALEKETKDERQIEQPCPSPLVEPLSERELEVLRLLTTHLSSTEIAKELCISVNTTRSHIKNIYSKLNVHRRVEAIQRAEELELL